MRLRYVKHVSFALKIMKSNRLAPWFSENSIAKARKRIHRYSKFCPMTISSTTIFNMAVLEPMQRIILQDEITEEDLAECRKIIYTLLQMENKGDVLPVPVQTTSSGKCKAVKKEEQYRLMYAELEQFLACHLHTEKHGKVLDCLLEVRNKPLSAERNRLSTESRGAADHDKRPDFNLSNDGVLRSTTESPMSPTAAVGGGHRRAKSVFGEGKSLLDLWVGKVQKENSNKHVPFHGIRNFGEKAKLYLSLERAKEQAATNGAEPMNVDS